MQSVISLALSIGNKLDKIVLITILNIQPKVKIATSFKYSKDLLFLEYVEISIYLPIPITTYDKIQDIIIFCKFI